MQEQWRRNAVVLWFAVLLHGISWTAIIPFMPVFLEQELGVQGAKAWAGVLASAFALCGAIFGPIWGAVGDRYGRVPNLVRAGVVMALTYLLMIFAGGPWELLGIRVLNGMFSGFAAIALSIVAVNTPPDHMGWTLSLQQTAFPAGILLGPAIGGVIYDLLGIRWAMGLSALLMLAASGLVILLVREDRVEPAKAVVGERQSLLADLKVTAAIPGLLQVLLITAIAKGTVAAVEPVFVPFVKELGGPGAPNWMAGVIFALAGVTFVVGVGWWARLADRVGYVRTLSFGLAGGAVLLFLQGMAQTPYDLAAYRLGGGLMEAAVIPGVSALLATTVPRSLRGKAFGLNLSAGGIGQVVGPLIGGFIGTFLGSRYVFFLGALGMAFGYIWAQRTFSRRNSDGEVE